MFSYLSIGQFKETKEENSVSYKNPSEIKSYFGYISFQNPS